VETKVEALEGNRAKITVTIDKDTVAGRVKKQYRDCANKYNFPGFRKGKAPRPVVDNMLGKDYVVATVTDDVVNETCPLAIDESGLYPVGKPEFDEDMALVMDGQEFVYTFEIETKPTPTLSDYGPVHISLPSENATAAEVDAEIETLLEHYYELVDAPANTKVKEDKFVDLKISATDDNGEEISSLVNDSLTYGIGSGLLPDSFDAELIGLKKGNTKQFTIDMPATATVLISPVMGKTAKINFDVEVLSVKKRSVPELTDEWVQEKIGMDDVASLRSELEDEINQQKGMYFPRMKESRCLAALSERLETEVSEGVIEEAETSLLQDFFTQLQNQGQTLDAYLQANNLTPQQFRDDIKLQATDVAKQDMALDAYAANAGFVATDEDIEREFAQAGASDPKALMEQWRQAGQMYLVRQGILRQKAVNEIVAIAVVADETPEPVKEKKGKHAAKSKKAEEPVEEQATEEAAAEE